MATYPNNRAALGQFAVLFTDAKLTQKAAIFDLSGKPLPGSQIIAQNGLWQEFTFAGSGALYYRAPDGSIDHLLPAATYAATVITGSRGGATVAVLTSVLAALAAQGVITDNTTA